MQVDENVAQAAEDTGIPADMLAEPEEGKAQKTNAQVDNGESQADSDAFARRLGWRPKEEFRGPEEKWLPADNFLEKVEKETPVLRERLRFQDDIITRQQTKIDEVVNRSKEQGELLREMLAKTREAEARGYARAQAEIEAEMDRAAAEADVDGYQAAKKRLIELGRAQAQAARPPEKAVPDKDEAKSNGQAQATDPAIIRFVQDNPWFNADPVMNAMAVTYDGTLRASNPNMSIEDRLRKVKEEVVKRFHDKFENAARKSPAAVSTPSAQSAKPNGAANKKTKTVQDLPEDARATLTKLKRLIPGYTDAEYLKDYQWDKQS